ncbi:AGE family epimerase/isomerase [Qingshengfaniella alkalisoli]|uniref:AGE family epimerase/isomerase n=1 Tax=Qingshengfaniella alkalisoli TaxID=2599296 RepID=A0A5B8ICJ7_9RHOB|nr:AGE family epimerase/isomerase [Qingshengfaniella alkalisoli]QDY71326.1 AGE family epimerase/isomerase [Qingshengfaniella alkalisoli]
MRKPALGPNESDTPWLQAEQHRAYLRVDAQRQVEFFRSSFRSEGGFHSLDRIGRPLPELPQYLHSNARMVHSFVLAKLAGFDDCDRFIDHGMQYIRQCHHDPDHGGYLWAVNDRDVCDDRKLAYGHVFVLLAAASAHAAGHPDAMALLDDVDGILDRYFWEDDVGRFCDEWNRDWAPFSTYRGMNANMHGTEALLAAFEATGREKYLKRAGRILDFFINTIARSENWRLPEHYDASWQIDRNYSEDPMFRPPGTTPGHSFELARLLLQYGELVGRPAGEHLQSARNLAYRALEDAWDHERGGFVYTLDFSGTPDIRDRYWWPVTEAIGVLAAFLKSDPTPEDEIWYRRVWAFADAHLVDHEYGGWFHELDADNHPSDGQFVGKPDIYHSLQAALLPLTRNVSGCYRGEIC